MLRASTPDLAELDDARAPARVRRLDDRLFAACGLAWAAGLIHVQAALQHIDEYLPHAVAFELLAGAQLWWGIAVYRAPTRGLLRIGALVSLLVVGVWIASRTSGLPIGPTPWRPEPIGPLDVLASADEALLAVLVTLRVGSGRGAGRALLAGALLLILLSSMALALGAHAH